MLSFEEFKVSSFYRARVLRDGEDSQDPQDMRRMHLEDQKEQYAKYVAKHESEVTLPSEEEKRVTLQLSKLRNNSRGGGIPATDQSRSLPEKKADTSSPVTLLKLTPLRNNDKSRADYMKNYRKKAIKCPQCGHEFHSIKRV